ncbi:MAG: hypothetical protein AAF627_11935 [Myxococcota bacterium]
MVTALEVFLNDNLTSAEVAAVDAALVADEWDHPLSSYPDVFIRYRTDVDEILISNDGLWQSYSGSGGISQATAKSTATGIYNDLVAAALIDSSDFDFDQAKSITIKQEYGSSGTPGSTSYVQEYRFRATKERDGIQFANGGIEIGVDVGGSLSHLRFGGVKILGVAGTFNQVVSNGDIANAFSALVAGASSYSVKRQGLEVIFPPGSATGVQRPTYVYAFTLETAAGVISRKQVIGYDLVTAGAPFDYVGTDPNETGDPR